MRNESPPFLSIIVPVYNAETYLKDCIESILYQDYKDFELILVNDGSNDSSLKICEGYEQKDSRIRVFSQENRGSIAARKNGVRAAKGHYIGFVDSDDWISPSLYDRLCHTALEYNVDIVLCDFISSYKNAEINITQGIAGGFYNKRELCEEIYPTMLCDRINNSFYKILPAYWNKIFRKEAISPYLLQLDERVKLGEDMVCVYPSLLKANSIYYLKNQYLYYYRQRKGSMSREYSSQCLNNFSILVGSLKKDTDCNEDFMTQTAGYICHKIEDTIEEALTYGTIRELKELFKKGYRGSELKKLVQGYDKRYLSCFQKVKFFFLNKEAYTALFVLYKIKQVIKSCDKHIDFEKKCEYYE